MSFVRADGAFWLTAVEGRAHVKALAGEPRVTLVVSNAGTGSPGRQMLAVRGVATVHRDRATLEWFLAEVHVADAAGRPRSLRTAARQSEAPRHRGATRRHRGQPRLPQDARQRPRWGRDVSAHLMVVLSNAKPGQDEPFNRWYSDVHMIETIDKLDGFVAAQRFRQADLDGAPALPLPVPRDLRDPGGRAGHRVRPVHLAAGGARRGDGGRTRAGGIRVGHAAARPVPRRVLLAHHRARALDPHSGARA